MSAQTLSDIKDGACSLARTALWYSRLERFAREASESGIPGWSWWSAPAMRFRIWRRAWIARHRARKIMRMVAEIDPAWGRRAMDRLEVEMRKPLQRTADGMVVIDAGFLMRADR